MRHWPGAAVRRRVRPHTGRTGHTGRGGRSGRTGRTARQAARRHGHPGRGATARAGHRPARDAATLLPAAANRAGVTRAGVTRDRRAGWPVAVVWSAEPPAEPVGAHGGATRRPASSHRRREASESRLGAPGGRANPGAVGLVRAGDQPGRGKPTGPRLRRVASGGVHADPHHPDCHRSEASSRPRPLIHLPERRSSPRPDPTCSRTARRRPGYRRVRPTSAPG